MSFTAPDERTTFGWKPNAAHSFMTSLYDQSRVQRKIFDYLNKIFIFAALFLKSCARHGTGYKDMKRLILIITLLFVVCNVNAGFLNPDYYIVHGKIAIDRRWGGYEGQKITLTFFRIAGLLVSLECKELGFHYEFKDSQGGILRGSYLEQDQLVTTKDGRQENGKNCHVKLGNFYFILDMSLQSCSVMPCLYFWPNVTDKDQKLVIDIISISHKYGETLEKQSPYTVTFEENWLYRMFKIYDEIEHNTHGSEPERQIRPSYE